MTTINKIKLKMQLSWEFLSLTITVIIALVAVIYTSVIRRIERVENHSEEIVKNYNVKLDGIQSSINGVKEMLHEFKTKILEDKIEELKES